MNISISGPSGVGKTTLIRSLILIDNRLIMLPSCTTRAARPNETHGIDYEFISKASWATTSADSWALVTEFNHHYYGFRKKSLALPESSRVCNLLNVDESGAKNLREEDPHCLNILILPPTNTSIRERLKQRGEPEGSARYEEALQWDRDWYHYVVINDELEQCCQDLYRFIEYYLP